MKILIASLCANINYGNRLQYYAVNKVLSDRYHADVCGIEYIPANNNFEKIKHYVYTTCVHKVRSFLWSKKNADNALRHKRYINFSKFSKKYIPMRYFYSLAEISSNEIDYYCIGSDQVWNVKWYDSWMKDIYLLPFVKANKIVCFSPSFGIEKLPDKWESIFREGLSRIPLLSVREVAGAKLIKDLTGKDAEVLIDPTLMLDAKTWNSVASKPRGVDCSSKYILTYFLGEQSEKVKMTLKKFEADGYQIYNFLDFSMPDIYVSGPSEFIYLISKASLVLTDSFHACVFSFIFDRPFLVYNREGAESDMLSRIDTLLSKFDLNRKYVGSCLYNDVFEHDYTNGKLILKEEREKVYKYLDRIISIE